MLLLKVWMAVIVSYSFIHQKLMRTHSTRQSSHHPAFMESAFWWERLMGP